MAAVSFRSSAPWLKFAVLGGLNAALLSAGVLWLTGDGPALTGRPREAVPSSVASAPAAAIVATEPTQGPAENTASAGALPYGPPAPPTRHRIRSGDTLYQISRLYYGDDRQFLAIYELNRALIGPDRSTLPVGHEIRLPAGAQPPRPSSSTAPGSQRPPGSAAPAGGAGAPLAASASPPREASIGVEVPVSTREPSAGAAERPALSKRWKRGVAAGLGLLTLGLWSLAGLMLYRERQRALRAERRAHWQALAARFPAQSDGGDIASLRGAWPLQFASSVLPGPQPGGCFVEARALSDHCLGLFVGAASSAPAQALVGRGLAGALWRALASARSTPGETFLALNRLLADYVPQGQHVTGFYAQFDALSGALSFAAAAHPQAYVLTAEGEWSLLTTGRGMPLGIGQELFAERLAVGTGRLREGDSLWLFTEGLLKVENSRGEPFGSARLEKLLRAHAHAGAGELVGRLKARLRGFAEGRPLPLDAAVLCFKVASPATADEPAARLESGAAL